MKTKDPFISPGEQSRIRDLYLASAFPVKNRPPRLLASAGNVAAGKTYLLRHLAENGRLPGSHALRHDPDAVMSEIPEYREESFRDPELAFQRWEMPARNLADSILEEGIRNRFDVIYDRTCAFPETVDFFKRLKRAEGYEIQMYFSYASLEECLSRSLKRAKLQRRFVPEAVIIERANALKTLLKDYCSLVDELNIYSNHDGASPRLVGNFVAGVAGAASEPEIFASFCKEYALPLA